MFDLKKMTQEMLQMQKQAFDQSYHTLTLLQGQMERYSQMCWGQLSNYPEEMKKGMTEWQTTYKKQCEQFKTMVDTGFKNMEAWLA